MKFLAELSDAADVLRTNLVAPAEQVEARLRKLAALDIAVEGATPDQVAAATRRIRVPLRDAVRALDVRAVGADLRKLEQALLLFESIITGGGGEGGDASIAQ